MGGVGGWLETDNRAISVQLNLTGTATGTELGKITNQHIKVFSYKALKPQTFIC